MGPREECHGHGPEGRVPVPWAPEKSASAMGPREERGKESEEGRVRDKVRLVFGEEEEEEDGR
ncbi:hypothetical protein SK128_022180, partial [Halocaridina rubra]